MKIPTGIHIEKCPTCGRELRTDDNGLFCIFCCLPDTIGPVPVTLGVDDGDRGFHRDSPPAIHIVPPVDDGNKPGRFIRSPVSLWFRIRRVCIEVDAALFDGFRSRWTAMRSRRKTYGDYHDPKMRVPFNKKRLLKRIARLWK